MLKNRNVMNYFRSVMCMFALSVLTAAAHASPSDALNAFETACLAQRWAQCHVAWFDLFAAGMAVMADMESSDDALIFIDNPDATERYRAVASRLDLPDARQAWDAIVTPLRPSDDLPSTAPARLGLIDRAWKDVTLDIIQQRFDARQIRYNVYGALKSERAEWLRYLTLVYVIRADEPNARQALGMLKKAEKPQASKVEALRQAVQSYFRSKDS